MIDYNLALELKNNGFIGKQESGLYYDSKKILWRTTVEDWSDGKDNDTRMRITEYDIYVPTLSELIEACGESFGELKRRWIINTFHAFGGEYIVKTSKWQFQIMDCKTPEIAVAKLWLALNKK